MLITRDWLKQKRACAWGIAAFAAEWPDGAEITATNLRRAIEIGLSIDWLRGRLQTPSERQKYSRVSHALWLRFYELTWPAWAESNRVVDAVLLGDSLTPNGYDEYMRVRKAAWAECNQAIMPIWAEHARIRDEMLIAAILASASAIRT